MTESVCVERDGDIATVVLNRPEKLNAITRPMWRALGKEIRALSDDESLRCIVVRGAGERAFSPGNDISEFETERSDVEQARAYGADMAYTLEALHRCPVPMVARIHGICVGGGLEIAAHCDVRVCGESSRFGAPINRLGLVMALPELAGLLRLVGRADTLELLLEGRIHDAREALRMGLVSRVVADDRVAHEVDETVGRIAAGAPLVARWHKKFVNRLEEAAPLSAEEIDEGYLCFGTEDFRIGYRAFLVKEKPGFVGR